MSPNPPPLDAEPEPKPDSGEAQPSVAMEATPSAVSLEMPSMSGTLVALLAAIVGTIQILALGTMARRVVIPGRREPWETIAFVIGLGEGLTGLTATILAIVGRFTFVWLELALLGEIGMFAVLCFIREGVT